MKKLVSIFLVLVLALCLVSCGETDVEPTPAGDDTPVDEGPKAPSVCVVVGNASDKSFSESLARGAALCGSELGSEYKVIEFGTDETKMLPTLEDLSEDGKWDIIAVAPIPMSNISKLVQKSIRIRITFCSTLLLQPAIPMFILLTTRATKVLTWQALLQQW